MTEKQPNIKRFGKNLPILVLLHGKNMILYDPISQKIHVLPTNKSPHPTAVTKLPPQYLGHDWWKFISHCSPNCEKLNYNFSHISENSCSHDCEKLSMIFHIFPKLQILSPIDENLIQNFHLLVKMLTIFTCLWKS